MYRGIARPRSVSRLACWTLLECKMRRTNYESLKETGTQDVTRIYSVCSWRATLLMLLLCGPVFSVRGWSVWLGESVRSIPNNSAEGQTDAVRASAINDKAMAMSNGMGQSAGVFPYTGSPLINTLVPPNSSMPIGGEFFGMTIHHTVTQFPPFPVSVFRFWDVVSWPWLEPSSGQFVWTRMDDTTGRHKKSGVNDFVFTFGSVPTWASSNPNEPCPGGDGTGSCASPDIAAFDEFAKRLVQRYCGVIKYYETWNEPNGAGYWKGNNAQLVTIAQHLFRIAKDPANCGCTNGVCSPNGGANPNKVLLPSISRINQPNLNWLDSYLSAAGPRYAYADIVAFHGYGSPTDAEQIANQVQQLKKVLAKHGLSNLPLWNTEGNWGSVPVVGPLQASWLMRYHMAQAAVGVSRVIWYAFDNCGWGVLWEAPWCKDPQMPVGQLTDPGRAYAVIEEWLAGANLTSCQVYKNGLWACELRRARNYDAWVVWSCSGESISIPIPESAGLTVYRDWQNKVNTLPSEMTVNQMPVLLESQNLSRPQEPPIRRK